MTNVNVCMNTVAETAEAVAKKVGMILGIKCKKDVNHNDIAVRAPMTGEAVLTDKCRATGLERILTSAVVTIHAVLQIEVVVETTIAAAAAMMFRTAAMTTMAVTIEE